MPPIKTDKVSALEIVNHQVIKNLEPRFADKILRLLGQARSEGMQVDAHSGLRTFVEQNRLYAKGRTAKGAKVTNARGGQSWHNYGVAADLVFKIDGAWSWAESHPWQRLGEIGKDIGLEWGGDWKTPDRPHFQLTNGLSIKQAQALHSEGGVYNVWSAIYKEKI